MSLRSALTVNQHVQAKLTHCSADNRGDLVTAGKPVQSSAEICPLSLTDGGESRGLRKEPMVGRQLRQVQVSLSLTANVNGRAVEVPRESATAARARISSLCLREQGGEPALISSLQLRLSGSSPSPGREPAEQSGNLRMRMPGRPRRTSTGVFQSQVVSTSCRGGRGDPDTAPSDTPGSAPGSSERRNIGTPHVTAIHNTGNQGAHQRQKQTPAQPSSTPCTRVKVQASMPVPAGAGRFSP